MNKTEVFNSNEQNRHMRGLRRVGLSLFYMLFIYVIIISTGCTNTDTMRFSDFLNDAENLIWQNPDSGLSVLNELPYEQMGEEEQVRLQMLRELGSLRAYQYTQRGESRSTEDSVIQNIVTYYRQTSDEANLCKALYTLGTIQYVEQNDLITATRTLKEAQYYIPYLEYGSPYAGMIYLNLAYMAADEQLYSVMRLYALQAIPFFRQNDDHLHLCAAYRDVAYADLYGDGQRETMMQYFDSAMAEAGLAHNDVMMYDILFHKELSEARPDTTQLLHYSKLLCDSFGIKQNAGNIVSIYLQKGETEEAEKYLRVLSYDTLSSQWSKEQFIMHRSRLLLLKGKKDSAFHELERMYGTRVEQLTADSRSRAYTISRLYDLEREQSRVMQLEIDKRRLRGGIIGSIAAIVIAILIFGLVYSYSRQKNVRIALQAEMQHTLDKKEKEYLLFKNESLKKELTDKRNALQHYLYARLSLTSALSRYVAKREDDIPESAGAELHELMVLTEKDWEQFDHDYNEASNNFMAHKHKQHPRLTTRDLRYIALYSLGFDNIDICLLFDIGKAAGWNIKTNLPYRLSEKDQEIEDILNSKPRRSEFREKRKKQKTY